VIHRAHPADGDAAAVGSGPVDQGHFRRIMGHVPTGVAVVTAVHEGAPAGLTVGSFTSVSLDPPLVAFTVIREARSWPSIEGARAFCVNVLAADQEHVCRRFAVSGGEKFRGVSWEPSTGGSPVIAGVLAWVDCELTNVYDGGDHDIVVGRVHDLAADGGAEPLLFYRGAFSRLWDWPVFE